MRQANGPASGARRTLVPVALGNRNNGHAIEIDYSIPTLGERRRLFSMLTLTDSPDYPASLMRMQEAAVRAHVHGIRNYRDDNGRLIETPLHFIEHAEDPIFGEIVAAILAPQHLTEEEKKTSPARSESKSSDTQA